MAALPTLRQMQFLTALVRHESFSRAAEACFVSQSTLSAGIKEFETILGAPVVDRSARGFALTPLGEEIARRAEETLALTAEMMRAAVARPPLTGEMRLGLIPTVGPFLLPSLMPRLEAEYPDLRLYLREDLTEHLLSGLRAGRLDMAVLALPLAEVAEGAGLESLTFAEDPFVFACRADHPLAGRDTVPATLVGEERLLLLEEGHCLREHALEACALRPKDEADRFGATSLYTLAQMVRSGLGVTLLPRLAVEGGLAAAAGLAVVPVAGAPSRDLGLVWRRGSGREAEARALAELAAEAVSDERRGYASP